MVAVLIFNHVYWFWQKTLLENWLPWQQKTSISDFWTWKLCWCLVMKSQQVSRWYGGWENFGADCGMRSFWCKVWNENFLLQIVECPVFAAICGMTSFFLWFVEWETFAANFGMRSEMFLLPSVKWELFPANCGLRKYRYKLWSQKCLLWIVEWEIFCKF